jgi:hypothetical protein
MTLMRENVNFIKRSTEIPGFLLRVLRFPPTEMSQKEATFYLPYLAGRSILSANCAKT